MKKILLPFWMLALISCINCTEPVQPPEPPTTPPDNSMLEVVWQVPMGPDTLDYFSIQPFIAGENVIFSRADLRLNSETLLGLDRRSGTEKWHWEPSFVPDLIPNINGAFISGNQIVVSYRKEVYSVDASNGQSIWSYQVPSYGSGWPRITQIGNAVYHQHHNPIVKDTVAHLVASSLSQLHWDTIYTLHIQDGYRPSFEMPGLWVKPSGDSVLIFQNRQWNFQQSDGRIDLHAYNLSSKTLEWSVSDIDPEGNSNVIPPYVYHDKVYFLGQNTLYCLDAFTGNLVWKRFFENDNLLVTNILIEEDRLFIKPSNDGVLYALDPATGQEIYKVPKTGTAHVNMQYFDGTIYYCDAGTGHIHAIRAADGLVIWDKLSPNYYKGKTADKAFFLNHLTIDPQQRVLYTNDSFYYLCIKLPK